MKNARKNRKKGWKNANFLRYVEIAAKTAACERLEREMLRRRG